MIASADTPHPATNAAAARRIKDIVPAQYGKLDPAQFLAVVNEIETVSPPLALHVRSQPVRRTRITVGSAGHSPAGRGVPGRARVPFTRGGTTRGRVLRAAFTRNATEGIPYWNRKNPKSLCSAAGRGSGTMHGRVAQGHDQAAIGRQQGGKTGERRFQGLAGVVTIEMIGLNI